MTCTEDGFSAWGKDMGGYSANPEVAAAIEETYQHSKGGYNEAGEDQFPCKDDRGYDWWTTDGELVLEDRTTVHLFPLQSAAGSSFSRSTATLQSK